MSRAIAQIAVLLATGTMSSSAQVRLTPAECEVLLVEKSDPAYPPLAKQAKLQGTVRANIVVSDTGVVVSTELVSGHPLLIREALDALKKRRYRPYLVNGKPVSFLSSAEITFSLGLSQDEYAAQQARTDRYIKQEVLCRELLNSRQWRTAEETCRTAVPLADQLADHQSLSKMSAYEHVGYALLAQQRYAEALEYCSRALVLAESSLGETDAELGYAYRNLAMVNHGLRDLDTARRLYGRAEMILKLAYGSITSPELKQRYRRARQEILKYHLLAAEDAGDVTEARMIKRQLDEKP